MVQNWMTKPSMWVQVVFLLMALDHAPFLSPSVRLAVPTLKDQISLMMIASTISVVIQAKKREKTETAATIATLTLTVTRMNSTVEG
jgi:hypothetical protein